jgi:hypothetical protein
MAQNANFSFQDYTSLLLTVGPALITYQQSTVAISHFNALGAEIGRSEMSFRARNPLELESYYRRDY